MTLELPRIRAARERLSELARLHPHLTNPEACDRLSAALPDALDTEDTMNDEMLNLRVPKGTRDRASLLLDRAHEIQEVAEALMAAKGGIVRAPRLSASLVLRLALLRGLETLELEQRERTNDPA